MRSSLPGFSADRSVAGPRAPFPPLVRLVTSDPPGVSPAQAAGPCSSPTSGDCLQCWSDCIAPCAPRVRDCFPLCRAECGGQPGSPAPIPCTPQDNSVNRNLCLGAITVWEQACRAICTATLGGVPVAGPALVAGCVAGCGYVATQSKNDCPPAVICV